MFSDDRENEMYGKLVVILCFKYGNYSDDTYRYKYYGLKFLLTDVEERSFAQWWSHKSYDD